MISIYRATEADVDLIMNIGLLSVEEAHRESCPAADLKEYLDKHYNIESISRELADPANLYHVLTYDGKPAGFSKIRLDAPHAGISQKQVTKLDRIYLLREYFDLKLGLELLNFNIALSKEAGQSGIWLFTWTGNTRAIRFYQRSGFQIIGEHYFKVSERHSNPNHHMFLRYGD